MEGNNQFALDLYGKLRQEEGNLFFSPYSISTALAMTHAGARGNTEKQMAQALHFGADQQKLHQAFSRLQGEINAVQKKGEVQLHVANALWAQKDYKFLKEFLAILNTCYEAGVTPMDFKTDAEGARKKINAWVEEKTKDKIKDLIKPGVLDAMTRLVLTNAIYFKGDWAEPFKEKNTKDEPFHLSAAKSVDVPMMTQTEDFRYMEDEQMQLLEMPYAGDEVSMLVILPKKVDGLAEIEGALAVGDLDAWIGKMHSDEVKVFLPRFTLTCEFGLADTLKEMGMPDAFAYGPADFSGMDGTRELFISAIIHKAFVDVNEKGTEAAAATAAVMTAGAMPEPPPVFRADHPFLFLIWHRPSGSILFMGRMANPKG
ncbi:MAG: serpin family protein [Planctomycetota bacterium]